MAKKVPPHMTTFLRLLKPAATLLTRTDQAGKTRKRPSTKAAAVASFKAPVQAPNTEESEPERRRPTSVPATEPISISSPSPSLSPVPSPSPAPLSLVPLAVTTIPTTTGPSSRAAPPPPFRFGPVCPLAEAFKPHSHVWQHLDHPTCLEFIKTRGEVGAFVEVERRALETAALARVMKEMYQRRLRETKMGLEHAKQATELEKQVAELEKKVEELEAFLASTNTLLDKERERRESVKRNLNQTFKSFEDHGARLNRVQANLETTKKRASKLEGDRVELQATRSELAFLRGELDNLRVQLVAARAEDKALRGGSTEGEQGLVEQLYFML